MRHCFLSWQVGALQPVGGAAQYFHSDALVEVGGNAAAEGRHEPSIELRNALGVGCGLLLHLLDDGHHALDEDVGANRCWAAGEGEFLVLFAHWWISLVPV